MGFQVCTLGACLSGTLAPPVALLQLYQVVGHPILQRINAQVRQQRRVGCAVRVADQRQFRRQRGSRECTARFETFTGTSTYTVVADSSIRSRCSSWGIR